MSHFCGKLVNNNSVVIKVTQEPLKQSGWNLARGIIMNKSTLGKINSQFGVRNPVLPWQPVIQSLIHANITIYLINVFTV